MDTKVNYTLVGAFVLILTMTLVIFIVWLSTGISTKRYKHFLVIMHESVSGLAVNSPVKYNGVVVGSVKKIYLTQNNPEQVRLLLQIEEHTPVTEGTTATLNSQGLTGIVYVALKGSDTHLNPIPRLHGEKYPIIKSTPSFFFRLDHTLRDLNHNMNQITEDINGILGGENPILLKKILNNLSITSQHLAAQSKCFDTILINTARSSRSFPALMNTLSQQTLPSTNQVLNNLSLITDNLLELSDHLRQNPSLLIRGQKPPPLGPGE
ncbi:MlaD family protein [Rickettsiella grylli]|uniref:ABC transport system periplasmic substrate binding protein n=1 Tax=Rickettsiella grylli TaxID=59196 RepID=A8PLY9_9COXI|nr:MlaD family protein [Rickettsiella grylli]EDP46896.1 ABC transport system periplasmic substrate binding protein [Rickettsiella grylli]